MLRNILLLVFLLPHHLVNAQCDVNVMCTDYVAQQKINLQGDCGQVKILENKTLLCELSEENINTSGKTPSQSARIIDLKYIACTKQIFIKWCHFIPTVQKEILQYKLNIDMSYRPLVLKSFRISGTMKNRSLTLPGDQTVCFEYYYDTLEMGELSLGDDIFVYIFSVPGQTLSSHPRDHIFDRARTNVSEICGGGNNDELNKATTQISYTIASPDDKWKKIAIASIIGAVVIGTILLVILAVLNCMKKARKGYNDFHTVVIIMSTNETPYSRYMKATQNFATKLAMVGDFVVKFTAWEKEAIARDGINNWVRKNTSETSRIMVICSPSLLQSAKKLQADYGLVQMLEDNETVFVVYFDNFKNVSIPECLRKKKCLQLPEKFRDFNKKFLNKKCNEQHCIGIIESLARDAAKIRQKSSDTSLSENSNSNGCSETALLMP